MIRFALEGYRFQVHVNGQSKPGYLIAFVAAVVGPIAGKPVALSWRGGLQQKFFPRTTGESAKLCEIEERDAEPVKQVQLQEPGNNVAKTADWLLGDAPQHGPLPEKSFVHV